MPPKKKASKKKDDVVAQSEPDEVQIAAPADEEHVLLNLPITDQQLNTLLHEQDMSNVLQYVPTIKDPEPYVPVNHFSNDADTIDMQPYAQASSNDSHLHHGACSESHNVPSGIKKSKMCFWCCHEVGHMVYGMPIRYDFVNKSFTMYGTFCSLECAAAHNFSVHLGSDRAWEIHSWIQMLGKRFGFLEPIRPAPSRYLLDMFDGPLSIEEFRNAHKGQSKTYVLNIPPLISVSSQMEVVNTSFLGNTEERSSTSHEKPARRTYEKRKTLDAKMNLTIQETV